MMDESSRRWGVDLKAFDPKAVAAVAKIDPNNNNNSKVNRSKASIFAWDDARLQDTAIVKKKVAKAAVSVQRFIRACISHWKYYNEERIPLEEELVDIERRRKEELIEVEEYKQRLREEAMHDIEAEMNMPKEQFDECQRMSKTLKQEIKDEEQVAIEIEHDINIERTQAKKLGREEHEIQTQHTVSRLDVEIPALEKEQQELQKVDDEFSNIVRALQAQIDDMEASLQMEIRHKKRLIRCIALMLKELQSRGAKAKLINNLKLIIKYKGEEPPPKPVQPEPTIDEATPENASNATDVGGVDEIEATDETKDEELTTIEPIDESSLAEVNQSETLIANQTEPSPDSESMPSGRSRRSSGAKKTKRNSDTVKKSVRDDQNDVPSLTNESELRPAGVRSNSPLRDSETRMGKSLAQKSSKSSNRDKSNDSQQELEPGFSWAEMEKVEQQSKGKRNNIRTTPPRNKTFDTAESRGKGPKRQGNKNAVDAPIFNWEAAIGDSINASFNWEAMAAASAQQDRGDKKDRSFNKSGKKKEKKDKRDLSDVAKNGHFSWAYYADNNQR